MLNYIVYLRAFACLLITNSHYKNIYPLDFLSFGGGFGVAIFYLISGFLLYPKIVNDKNFLKWYGKKVGRLYCSWWLFLLLRFLYGSLNHVKTYKDFFQVFIFPTTWFVASMVILYGVYYWIVKLTRVNYEKKIIRIFILLNVFFLITFILRPNIASWSLSTMKVENFALETPSLIMQIIWLECMLVGATLRKRKTQISTLSATVLFVG